MWKRPCGKTRRRKRDETGHLKPRARRRGSAGPGWKPEGAGSSLCGVQIRRLQIWWCRWVGRVDYWTREADLSIGPGESLEWFDLIKYPGIDEVVAAPCLRGREDVSLMRLLPSVLCWCSSKCGGNWTAIRWRCCSLAGRRAVARHGCTAAQPSARLRKTFVLWYACEVRYMYAQLLCPWDDDVELSEIHVSLDVSGACARQAPCTIHANGIKN